MSVLLVEQNVRMSLEVADDAYVLENGKIVYAGRPRRWPPTRTASRRWPARRPRNGNSMQHRRKVAISFVLTVG